LTAAGQVVVGVARAISTAGKKVEKQTDWPLRAGRPKKKRKGNGHGNGK
jgi:hypothetical protein